MTLTPSQFASALKTPCSTQLIREYCRKKLIKSTRVEIQGGFEYRIPESQIAVFENLATKKRRGWPLGKKREGSKNLANPEKPNEAVIDRMYSACKELNTVLTLTDNVHVQSLVQDCLSKLDRALKFLE